MLVKGIFGRLAAPYWDVTFPAHLSCAHLIQARARTHSQYRLRLSPESRNNKFLLWPMPKYRQSARRHFSNKLVIKKFRAEPDEQSKQILMHDGLVLNNSSLRVERKSRLSRGWWCAQPVTIRDCARRNEHLFNYCEFCCSPPEVVCKKSTKYNIQGLSKNRNNFIGLWWWGFGGW